MDPSLRISGLDAFKRKGFFSIAYCRSIFITNLFESGSFFWKNDSGAVTASNSGKRLLEKL